MVAFRRDGGGSPVAPKKPLNSGNARSTLTSGNQKITPQSATPTPFNQSPAGFGFMEPVGTGTVLRQQSASAPASPQVDGGSGGGGYGGTGGGYGGPVPSIGDYEANDQILTAALGALDRAMKDYEAQYATDTANYDRDFNEGQRNLGWRDLDAGEPVSMGWDWNDVLSSSGRAYQNQVNDFANRGMLQSQGYLDAQSLLERSLNDQKGAMESARTDFMGDLGRRRSEFQNQDTLARQQARAEAASRRAAEYGIV